MPGEKEKYKCRNRRCLANYQRRCALMLAEGEEREEKCEPMETNFLYRYGTCHCKADAVKRYMMLKRDKDREKRIAERNKILAERAELQHKRRMELIGQPAEEDKEQDKSSDTE